MKNGIYINNSKRLIVGISIIFFTVILIIGLSYAYFTQSKMSNMDNIVSTGEVTLNYRDNLDYMRNDLIPSSEEYAKRAYAIEGTNKCKDDNGYNICSIYQFTVVNNINVAQEIMINMTPTINNFTNLKFMLYEINNGVSKQILSTQPLTFDDKTTIPLVNNITLNQNSSKTYEIVYYILNIEETDQTILDANKNFGATININSITSGTYISNQEGASCWKTEPLNNGTNSYKLTEFYGINNDNSDIEKYGKIINGCESYVSIDDNDNFYTVNVPATYGGNNIKVIGNNLFNALVDFSEENEIFTYNFNNYNKIKTINVASGIEEIENADRYNINIPFGFIGFYYDKTKEDPLYGDGIGRYEFNFKINLPNTLKYIGNNIFESSTIKEISIPYSVETIAEEAFGGDPGTELEKVNFELDENGNSNLKNIGQNAFGDCDLKNETDENNNVISLVIPKSVETIGNRAFGYNDLTSITFEGANNNTSNLKNIGRTAFAGNNLTYTDSNNPLVIPASVIAIGEDAFASRTDSYAKNIYLNYIKFSGTLTLGNTNWYTSIEKGGVTTLIS